MTSLRWLNRQAPLCARLLLAAALGACSEAPAPEAEETAVAGSLGAHTLSDEHSPPSGYAVERFTEVDGLSNTSVISITQGPRGFMWFGTWNGLNRYDGHEFKTYEHDPADPNSIPHSWAEALHTDANGTLWVGTFGGGLARYDPSLDGFHAFRHDPGDPTTISQDTVTAVLRDRQGTLWIGTHQGLNRLDEVRGTFVRYRSDPDDPTSLSNDQVRALYEDRQGTLWVGTGSTTLAETPVGEGGLNRYDPEADAFVRHVHDPGDPTSIFHNKVRAMFEDEEGTFWVGTAGNVLHRMDREAGTFERLAFDPARPDRLVPAASVSIPSGCGDPCGTITFLSGDPYGRLWAGIHSVGLVIVDREGAVRHYAAGPEGEEAIGSDLPWSLFFGADGTTWLGAINGGLHRMTRPADERESLFKHVEIMPATGSEQGDQNAYFETMVNDIEASRDGTVWVALKDGLDRYDPESATFTRIPVRPGDSSAVGGPVSQVVEAADGTVWALGYKGVLYRVDGEGGPIERVGLNVAGPFSDSFETLFKERSSVALYAASDGALWVGTLGRGLRRYDPGTGRLTTIRHGPALGPAGDVVDFAEVGGALWVATTERLVRLDGPPDAPRLTAYSPPAGPGGDLLALTDLLRDRQGRLLVGTTQGLYVFEPGSGAFVPLNSQTDLLRADAAVGSLVEGSDGHLWISTYQGSAVLPVSGRLVRYDPADGSSLRFDIADGLPSIGFREHVATRAPDGTLYFGGIPGFVAVSPRVIDRDRPPTTVLTGLDVFGEPAVPGPSAPIKRAITVADRVVLEHDQHDFTLSFTGIDFRAPGEVRYQHRLVPYDLDWIDDGGRRSARYSRVPPGDYVFNVRAANRFGVWSEAATAIPVVVRPPWWQTWWAYALYALTAAGVLVAVDRTRRHQAVRRERARTETERRTALLREKELTAEAAEARANLLQAENKRQMQELEQTRQIEQAYRELEASHAELRRAQDRLVQQEKLASLGQLTAGIAHEIKNPLNFVTNFSELNQELAQELREALNRGDVLEATELVDDIEQNAAFVHQHGRRADSIVKSMMAHARSGGGQSRPVDLNALVEEHVELAYHGKRTQTMGFDAAIERDYDEAVGTVEVVPQEIGRVLLNLLSNAFDAVTQPTHGGDGAGSPTVAVTTRRDGDVVEISVADDGVGVPSESVGRIFEPFYTTKPTGEGTGLGLSMSYEIVVQGYGGTLTVESVEGEGATFRVSLPLAACAPPPVEAVPGEVVARGGRVAGRVSPS